MCFRIESPRSTRMAGGPQTTISASNEDLAAIHISASSTTIYVVVNKAKVVGQYDDLADARVKLLEYTGHGNSRMVVPVTELLSKCRAKLSQHVQVAVGKRENSVSKSEPR